MALEALNEASKLFRASGDAAGEAGVLVSMGDMERELGHYVRAGERYAVALNYYRQNGPRDNEARTLMAVAEMARLTGRSVGLG